MRNLFAGGFGRVQWRRLSIISSCGCGFYPGNRTLCDYNHPRRCSANRHDYRFSNEWLYRKCERSRRLLTQRRHCYTDDPVDGSRRAAAD